MAAEQGKDTPTGPVPNIQWIYSTTVPAEELARALADHFRAREFEAQVFRTSGDRTVMQARKESLWHHLLGVAYALTVVVTPGEGQPSIGLGGHEWGRCGGERDDRAGGGPAVRVTPAGEAGQHLLDVGRTLIGAPCVWQVAPDRPGEVMRGRRCVA